MNYSFGNALKTYRESSRLTQAELAEKIDVTPEIVSKWENDKGEPSEDNLDLLIDTFGEQLGVEYLKSKSKIAMRCLSGISYKPKTPREVPYLQSITVSKGQETTKILSEILINESIDDNEVDAAYKCIKLMEESIIQQLDNLAYFKDMYTKKIKNENWLMLNTNYKSELFK